MTDVTNEPKKPRGMDFTVLPNPDDRTVTIQICDILHGGTRQDIIETLHFLPRPSRRQKDPKPLSAAWFGRATKWAIKRLENGDRSFFKNPKTQRVRLMIDGVAYYFKLSGVSRGIKMVRKELESKQMRML